MTTFRKVKVAVKLQNARTYAAEADYLMQEVERLVLAQPEKYNPKQDLRVYIAQLQTIEKLVKEAHKHLIYADMAMGRA